MGRYARRESDRQCGMGEDGRTNGDRGGKQRGGRYRGTDEGIKGRTSKKEDLKEGGTESVDMQRKMEGGREGGRKT